MGQKVHPIGIRLGIIKGWESNWYSNKKDFSEKIIEDEKIRTYLNARIQKGGISKIVIERTMKRITITIHTSRPGIVIGKGGGEVDRIKEELKKITNKDIQINIMEIRRPELDASIVGETIAKQIEARISYKRAIKMAIASTMRMGAEGIKVRVSGRLGGVEIARREEIKQGRTPLHTLRADIDYSWKEANTVYGKIGIKTWICKGELFGKVDLSPNLDSSSEGFGANTKMGGSDDRRRDDRRRGGIGTRGGSGSGKKRSAGRDKN